MLHLEVQGWNSFRQRHRLLSVVMLFAVPTLAKVILFDRVVETHLGVQLDKLPVVHDRLKGSLHTVIKSFVSLSSNNAGLLGISSGSASLRTDAFL